MKKLKALIVAIFLILGILYISIPDVNYGQGPENPYNDEYNND